MYVSAGSKYILFRWALKKYSDEIWDYREYWLHGTIRPERVISKCGVVNLFNDSVQTFIDTSILNGTASDGIGIAFSTT